MKTTLLLVLSLLSLNAFGFQTVGEEFTLENSVTHYYYQNVSALVAEAALYQEALKICDEREERSIAIRIGKIKITDENYLGTAVGRFKCVKM